MDSDTLLGLFFVSLTTVFLFVYIKIKRSRTSMKTVESDSTSCKSPNCVRCQIYSKTMSRARSKFLVIADELPLEELRRVAEGLDCKEFDYKLEMQKPNVFYMTKLTAIPFWGNSCYFDDYNTLLATFKEIKFEALALYESLLDGDVEGWLSNSTDKGQWSLFHFMNQGKWTNSSEKRCPKTFKCLKALPSLMKDCVFGNAAFSLLTEESVIAGHYGPCNIRIRSHLGISIPEDTESQLTVANESKTVTERQLTCFDDSFWHSAKYSRNKCGLEAKEKVRIVLLLDFWHPGLTTTERKALSYIFKPEE